MTSWLPGEPRGHRPRPSRSGATAGCTSGPCCRRTRDATSTSWSAIRPPKGRVAPMVEMDAPRPARLGGVVPVVPTPFLDDGALDLDGQRRVLDFLVDAGSHA